MRRIFKDVDRFMVRTPSLPIKTFIENTESPEDFEDLNLKNFECYRNQFEEAVFIGSHDLYNAMDQYIKGNRIGDKADLLNSFLSISVEIVQGVHRLGCFLQLLLGKYPLNQHHLY